MSQHFSAFSFYYLHEIILACKQLGLIKMRFFFLTSNFHPSVYKGSWEHQLVFIGLLWGWQQIARSSRWRQLFVRERPQLCAWRRLGATLLLLAAHLAHRLCLQWIKVEWICNQTRRGAGLDLCISLGEDPINDSPHLWNVFCTLCVTWTAYYSHWIWHT